MHVSMPLLVGKESAVVSSRTDGRPHATYAFAAASESGSQRTSDSHSGGAIRSGMLPLSRCLTGRRGELLAGSEEARNNRRVRSELEQLHARLPVRVLRTQEQLGARSLCSR